MDKRPLVETTSEHESATKKTKTTLQAQTTTEINHKQLTLNKLKLFTKEQLLQVLKQVLPEKKLEQVSTFEFDGADFCSALEIYRTTIESNGTKETATNLMISYLQKAIPEELLVTPITFWLLQTFNSDQAQQINLMERIKVLLQTKEQGSYGELETKLESLQEWELVEKDKQQLAEFLGIDEILCQKLYDVIHYPAKRSPDLTGFTTVYEWLDNKLNSNLKERFRAKLDTPFKVDNNSKQNITRFESRDSFKRRVSKITLKNVKAFELNSKSALEKQQDFKYGIIANGTGNGKTRACKEIQNYIPETKGYKRLHIYLAFDNGCSVVQEENFLDPVCEGVDGKIVGARILSTLYDKTMAEFVSCIGESQFNYLVKEPAFKFELVLKLLGGFLEENERLILSLALDEVQNLKKSFLSLWKQPLYCIGAYMVNTRRVNSFLVRDRICVVPFISGVELVDRMRIQATDYGNMFFSLPPLYYDHIWTICNEFLSLYTFSQSSTTLAEYFNTKKPSSSRISIFKELLVAGLVPELLRKSLLVVSKALSQHSKQRWDQLEFSSSPGIVKKIRHEQQEYYCTSLGINSTEGTTDLLQKVLCSADITPLSENSWESKSFQLGRCYLSENNCLFLPPPIFKELIKTDEFLREKIENPNPIRFEHVDLKCLVYRLSYLKAKATISIKQIFPGAIISESLKNRRFKLDSEQFEIRQSRDGFISVETKTDENTVYQINTLKCDKSSNAVFTEVNNHPSVDGHFTLRPISTNENEKLPQTLFLIQYRLFDTDTSPNILKWLEKGEFANNAVKEFGKSNIDVVFVFITTTHISAKKMVKLAQHTHFERLVVIHYDDSLKINPLTRYMPVNLLPYFMTFLYKSERHIKQIPKNDETHSSQTTEHIADQKEMFDML